MPRLSWMLRRAADWVAYHDYEPWQLATKRWMAESVEEDNCRICSPELTQLAYEYSGK